MCEVLKELQRQPLEMMAKRVFGCPEGVSKFQPQVGDVVIIKTDDKNCGTWPLATVSVTYAGKDGIIRAVELKTTRGRLERPVQHLYPLEITCDKTTVAVSLRQARSYSWTLVQPQSDHDETLQSRLEPEFRNLMNLTKMHRHR